MTKFGCAWKDKKPQFYGAERLRTDESYNLDLVSRADCDKLGMPPLAPCNAKPAEMMGFNYAKTATDEEKRGRACCFFIDDYQFERVWNSPLRYVDNLRGFDCVLTPDFSLYMDMPLPVQIWNVYRSRVVGYLWQAQGLDVIPTLSWAQPDTYRWAFDGLPKHATVATSTKGVMTNKESQETWRAGMTAAMKILEPRRVLLYGVDIDFDFGDAEVVRYANTVTERMKRDGR